MKQKSSINLKFFEQIYDIVHNQGFSCNSSKYKQNPKLCCIQWWKLPMFKRRLRIKLDESKQIIYSKRLNQKIMDTEEHFSFPWDKIQQKNFDVKQYLVTHLFIKPVQKYNSYEDNTLSGYQDKDGIFKKVLTNFISSHLFDNKANLFYFLKCIVTVYQSGLEQYIKKKGLFPNSIIFTFKGGNILRLIERILFRLLSGYTSELLYDFYSIFFKKGDYDFGIFIHPLVPNYEQVFQEVTLLNYYLQTKLRQYFIENNTEFFSVFKYNLSYLQTQLYHKVLHHMQTKDLSNNLFWKGKKILNVRFIHNTSALSEEEVLQEITTIIMKSKLTKKEKEKQLEKIIDQYLSRNSFKGGSDFLLQYKKNINRNQRLLDSDYVLYLQDNNKQRDIFNISYNTALHFYTNKNSQEPLLKIFNLIRTKMVFQVEVLDENYNLQFINLSGELIDVSIAHRCSDIEMQSFYFDYNKSVQQYSITNYKNKFHPDNIVLGENKLDFFSYSIEYLIEDLEKILYYENKFPWDDKKYKKRIYRICLLSFLQLLEIFKSNSLRIFYLMNLFKYCKLFLRKTIVPSQIHKYYTRIHYFETNKNISTLESLVSKTKQHTFKETNTQLFRRLLQSMNITYSSSSEQLELDSDEDSDGEQMYHHSSTVMKYIHSLNTHYHFLFFRLIYRIQTVIYPQVRKKNTKANLSQFKEMIQVILDNCQLLIQVLSNNNNVFDKSLSLSKSFHQSTIFEFK